MKLTVSVVLVRNSVKEMITAHFNKMTQYKVVLISKLAPKQIFNLFPHQHLNFEIQTDYDSDSARKRLSK